MKVSIKEEIGIICIKMEMSFLLIKKLKSNYIENEKITLDFSGISIYSATFFNGLIHAVDDMADISLLDCINLPSHGNIAYDFAIDDFMNKPPQDEIRAALKNYVKSEGN